MLHFFLFILWLSLCTSKIAFQGQYYLLAHELINELCKSPLGDPRAFTVTTEFVVISGGEELGKLEESNLYLHVTDV